MSERATGWPERVEYEVNQQLGGDATVGEIVALMLRLGWQPPADKVPEHVASEARQ